jgi:hypothetical protein
MGVEVQCSQSCHNGILGRRMYSWKLEHGCIVAREEEKVRWFHPQSLSSLSGVDLREEIFLL